MIFKKKSIVNNDLKSLFFQGQIDNVILNQAKREKNVIYGARSIQKQIGIYSRPTQDWDIFSTKPKKSAMNTEKSLDKSWNGDFFYVKPALHPGTIKVMSKGSDGIKGTKDDYGVVDYSNMPKPKPKYVVYNGVRYRKLTKEKKAKYKSLKDKTQEFRHQKDNEDLQRIKFATGKSR